MHLSGNVRKSAKCAKVLVAIFIKCITVFYLNITFIIIVDSKEC